MRITFFSDIAMLGGGELWVLAIARWLRGRGHDISIVCPHRSHLFAACVERGFDVFGFNTNGNTPFHRPLFHFLRKHQTDVLYTTVIGQFCEAVELGAIVAQLNAEREERGGERKAILLLKTGLPPMQGRSPEYYGFGGGPEVRRLHVVSEENRRQFAAWSADDGEFVKVMREGVDLTRFDGEGIERAARRHQLSELGVHDVDDATRIVTCVARLHPLKGLDNLLLAAREVLATAEKAPSPYPLPLGEGLHFLRGGPASQATEAANLGKVSRLRRGDVRFVFAGQGGELERLRAMSRELRIADRVHFVGHVQDVPGLLAASDLFCYPSLADGMPNAVVEALAMGLPVIASAVGGVPELIADGESGLLVTPQDVRQLTQSITRLLDDEPLASRLGARAALSVRAQLDFNSCCEAWEAAVAAEHDAFQQANAASPPAQQQQQQQQQPQQPQQRRRPPDAVAQVLPVMLLLNHLRTGGEETEAAILAKYVDRTRYPISVLTAWPVGEPSPAATRLRRMGVEIDEGAHAVSSMECKADYIVRKIRRDGIRIVIACQDTKLAHQVFEQLRPDECRLIEHAGIEAEVHRIPKAFTSRLVGVSPAIARAAARHFPHQPGHALYLPSIVDVADYWGHDRASLRDAYNFAADDIVIMFVGRMDAKKGITHLIDAASLLLPDHPNLRFLVIGPPDAFQPAHSEHLLHRARTELPPNRFIFAGARDDVAQLLTAADIFVLPARGEGMSHAINEAGAASLPVVTFDDGAAAQQLDNGAAGILVPPGDSTALVAALRTLIESPDLRARLGAALRARVLDEFSAQRVIPRWQMLFDEVAIDLPRTRMTSTVRRIPEHALAPFPAEIQIETNTACNATCVMCPYPEVSKEMKPGRMDAQLYEKILGECATEPTVWRLEPFLNNEPFTDVRMVDWIAMAKQRVPHAIVTVTTNGSLVTPKITDRLIHSGLDAIWFSFNGATKETYEQIMGLSFDQVKKNIDYLLDKRPQSLRVYTNMIDTVPMRGEIAENVRYWQSRGVQSGSSPFVNRAGNVLNFDELNYRAHTAQPARLCELLYRKMYIGYNGDVLLCCMDWRRRVVLGNAREQSLREIWLGERYQHYRQLHEEGRVNELELCSKCSYVHA
jgi:radical SAM protein with 4Fe4S-binding SPASM domain